MLNLFTFLIFVHFLGDFPFQSNIISKRKKENICYLFMHLLIHCIVFLSSYVIVSHIDSTFLIFDFSKIFIVECVILSCHLIIDILKNKLEIKIYSNKEESLLARNYKLYLYVIDQLIHVGIIYLVVTWATKEKVLSFLNTNLYKNFLPTPLFKYLWIILIFILGTYFAAYFIQIFLTPFGRNLDKSEMKNNLSFGIKIGLIERTLIMILVSTSNFTAITVVIAVKTLTRFKEIELNENFGEYYLIGNLLSLLFSIVSGILIKMFMGL